MASTSMSSHADGVHIDTDGSISELRDQHNRLQNEHTPDSPHAISPDRAHEHTLESKHKILLSHSGAQKASVEQLLPEWMTTMPEFDEFLADLEKEEKERKDRLRKKAKERLEHLLKEKEKYDLVYQILLSKKNEGLKKTLHPKSKK